jgi:hypothetical protein
MSHSFSRAALFLSVVSIGLFPFVSAQAQFAIPQIASIVSITATPASPAPHQRVHLSVGAFTTDVSAPSWTVNGKTVAANSDGSLDIQVGSANEKTVVTVSVTGARGRESATRTLIPATIDLLVDSTSYTPPFFKGRPLASAGTAMRVQAIPHLGGGTTPVSIGNITFTWRQGGTVVASGRGVATVVLSGPPLFGSDTLSVDAQSVDGLYGASASITIPGLDPKTVLYIDNPLVGVEYYNALQDGSSVADVESSLIAVPYFTDAVSLHDPRFTYEWSVNGQPLSNADTHSNEITVNSGGSNGDAHISLMLSSTVNFFIHADQDWNLSFKGTGGIAPSTATSLNTNR